jgi:15-cis-phytoene synthase
LRPAFDALFAIDDAMGDVVAKASDPALAAIKLAWWREQLEELDRGKVPAEPRLKAAAEHLLPCGVNGAQLAQIEEGWAVLLQDEPDMGLAEARGGRLFGIGAVLIGLDHKLLEGAGRLFAGIDFARRGYRKIEPSKIAMGGIQFPGPLRPLTALTALAFRDLKHGGPPFEAEATPARALALLRHRMFGRIG